MEININDIKEFLHQEGKQNGSEISFQCPLCAAMGNDKHKDNLKYNTQKNVLYCFANEQHSKEILSEIYKSKKPDISSSDIPTYKKCQEDYLFYQSVCSALLWGNKTFLIKNQEGIKKLWSNNCVLEYAETDKPERAKNYLLKKRGLLVSDSIGLDPEKAGKWVIPIYNMQSELVGFEYRGLDFDNKRVWREKGTPKCLAQVYGAENSKRAVIVEGFLDGYVLAAHVPDIFILTPAHGVSMLYNCITELQFNKYEEICLILDNDEAGNAETEKIIDAYPFIKDCRKFLIKANVKDIGEYYVR